MEQKLKKYDGKNRGITLIALVITIVVMLILVAVTISMAVNGGLFDYAGKAVGETHNALNAEQELSNGRIEVDGVWYDSIDDYLKGKPAVITIHSWTRSGDTFSCSHCNTKYTMGEIVDYKSENVGETKTATLTAAKTGLDKYYKEKSKYPKGAKVDENGNQTLEVQDVNWVVLGIEDTNKDGVYETLLITTEMDLWLDMEEWIGIFFYGTAEYNNGVDEINRICRELYSNSEYGEARGMTIDDVNSALNYTPMGGMYYNIDEDKNYITKNLTTKLKSLPIFSSIVPNGTNTPDGTNTQAALGEYELNGYTYYINDDGTAIVNDVNDTTSAITQIEKDVIFGVNEDYCYLLASRGVKIDVGVTPEAFLCSGTWFGLGEVDGLYVNSSNPTFYSTGVGKVSEKGFRPVVPLRSKLPAKV